MKNNIRKGAPCGYLSVIIGIVLPLSLLSCSEQPIVTTPEPTEKIDTTKHDPLIPVPDHYRYILALDSTFETWLPTITGTTPKGIIVHDEWNNPFIYDFTKVPRVCWVWRFDQWEGTNEDCKLVGETLYCPSDTSFIDWEICCPDTLGFNRNAQRPSSSSL